MSENTEKKARLAWEVKDGSMVCTFPEVGKLEFVFGKIEGYVPISCKIQHDLFVHGMKQKLADCIAGMKDNTWEERKKFMGEKWEEIYSGKARTRANSADPKLKQSDVFAAIDKLDISDDMKVILKAQVSGK